MRIKLSCLVSAWALFTIAPTQIAQYTAPGGSFNPTSTGVGATASALNDTGSSASLDPGVTLPNSVFLQQLIISPNPAAAVANAQYFQFSVTPHGGRIFNFSSLTFDAARGGASTPRGWVLRSSIDGFANDIATQEIPTVQPNLTNYSVSLAGAPFQNVVTETIFRIYGFAPGGAGTGNFFDNITLNGSILGNELVRYEAPNSSFAPTSVGANITASDLNDTGSSASLDPGFTLPNSVFLQQQIVSPTPADAVANNQFFQFTVDVAEGFEMDLGSLAFDVGRGGASTPRGWVLRSSLDGFGADIATAEIPTVQPSLTGFSVDLSAGLFQDLTSDVTFRIYGYAPGGVGTGSFYDNIVLYGSTTPVPEPASLAVLGLGALVVYRRKRRSA